MKSNILIIIYILSFSFSLFCSPDVSYRNIGDDIYLLEIEGTGWILSGFDSQQNVPNLLSRFQDGDRTFFRLRFSAGLDCTIYFTKQNLVDGDFASLSFNLAKDLPQELAEDSPPLPEERNQGEEVVEVEGEVKKELGPEYYLDLYSRGYTDFEDDDGYIFFIIAEYFEGFDNLEAKKNAIFWYEKIIEYYPFSEYSAQARVRVVYLLNKYINIK
ncbi:MAG: hypothetical protein JXR63_04750 [Spirochaetales bacterium]|nr:hypothetical protein [Spirochaetales bacterium]